VEFRILGPLEVTAHGQSLEVGGARTRAVLAMLLVHANQVVSADRLVQELWTGHPADKAAASLQVRLSELRRALRRAGEADRLATRPPGYLLQVKPGESDVVRFEQPAAEAQAALAAGEAALAAQRLDEALALWRGPALADVALAASVRAEAGRLEERRLAAQESRAEALLACGRHRELIAEFLGTPEEYGAEPLDYARWPLFAKLDAAREAGQLAVWCFGLGTDPLTLATDVLVAAVFRADVFDALFGQLVAANDEGRVVSWAGLTSVPFTAGVVHRFAGGSEPMQPAGASVLELAWRHRARLLG
jgi:DNA-binding winged helix-turn-helix (wHTH) protein